MKDLREYIPDLRNYLTWILCFLKQQPSNDFPIAQEIIRDIKICLRRIELFYLKNKDDDDIYAEINNFCVDTFDKYKHHKANYIFMYGDIKNSDEQDEEGGVF